MLPKKQIYFLLSTLVTIKSDSCPANCRCYPAESQRSVVCDGSGYTSLPTDLPTWMIDLDMSNNQISRLDADAFVKFPKLQVVRFKRNLLGSLPKGLFDSNPLMYDIDFSQNGIADIPEDLFKSTFHVRFLNLENNKISELREEVFGSMQQMDELRLSKNSLTSLPKLIFDKLTRLELLELKLNVLQCCDVIDALNHVDTDAQARMDGSCMGPHRNRFALKTVVSDQKLKCPGRSNPNNNNNQSNTLGIVQVAMLGVCVVLLMLLSTVAVVRFVRGRSGIQHLHEEQSGPDF